MNKIMATIVLLSLLLAGCGQHHLAVWGLTSTDLDSPSNAHDLRIGLCNGDEGGDTEFGIEMEYAGLHNSPESFNMYGTYHLGGDPSSWLGQPYVGYRIGTDGDGGQLYGPIAGTLYWNIFVIEARFAQEYTGKLGDIHNDENDEVLAAAGLRWEF